MKRILIAVVVMLAVGGVSWLAVQRLSAGTPAGRLYGNVEIRQVDLAFNSEGTVLTMLDDPIRFTGYEVVKAFEGQTTHDTTITLPVVENDQDIARLSRVLEPILLAGAPLGYLIRGHGCYISPRVADSQLISPP